MAKASLTQKIIYAPLAALLHGIALLPFGALYRIADVLYVLMFYVLRYRKKVVIKNLNECFPDKSESEVNAIAVRSISNMIQTAVEMIRAPRLTREWMDRHIIDGKMYKDRLQEYVDEGKGVVIMVPHSGNWYMAAWSMAKYGLPLFAIAAKQRNPKIDAWMKRQYCDIEVVERGSARTLVEIKRKLSAGRAFAILPDLRVPQRDVEVDFLGGKANVSHAAAMFAVNCGSPVVVAMMTRSCGNRHEFHHLATLRPDPAAVDKKEEAARITREAMALLDEGIRKHPGDWFWYNKRWILQPV
jgi:KDO2-lipid IV(A) lauroyltransferase